MPESYGPGPFRQLLATRLRLFFREPGTIFWVYVFPLMLMIGLGIAFSRRGEPVYRVRVAGDSPAAVSALLSTLQARGGIVTEAVPLEAALSGPPDAGWDLTVIREAEAVRYLYDPARAESRLAHLVVDGAIQKAAGRVDSVPSRFEPRERPGTRYIDWLVPGLVGLNIMGGGMWGVGFVVVDLRIRMLLKRFRATPMRRSHFLGSLMAARLFFLAPELTVILGAGALMFGLRVRGSFLALIAVALVGAAAFAGLGLLLASRARKIETISGLLNAVMMPMWILSGVFFSSERFPAAIQPLVRALPLTQLNDALREVILQGGGLVDVAPSLGVLLLWGGISFPLALRWFRW